MLWIYIFLVQGGNFGSARIGKKIFKHRFLVDEGDKFFIDTKVGNLAKISNYLSAQFTALRDRQSGLLSK